MPAGCGGTLRNNTGKIMSPNYPSSYPHSARCTWTIEGPEQTIIRLDILKFKLEKRDQVGHCWDRLEVS